jgi:hypothetical protein
MVWNWRVLGEISTGDRCGSAIERNTLNPLSPPVGVGRVIGCRPLLRRYEPGFFFLLLRRFDLGGFLLDELDEVVDDVGVFELWSVRPLM